MPINPHPEGSAAATMWGDQVGAEIRERAEGLFEQVLHSYGLCTDKLNPTVIMFLDQAMECGVVAMGQVLEEKGRLKEAEV